ncbi:MAG: hypothetical protein KAT46_01130 [Deltaproteobacteria bacterium]|nr:hypothetical protein [Deltaproteobacteria bacterium]
MVLSAFEVLEERVGELLDLPVSEKTSSDTSGDGELIRELQRKEEEIKRLKVKLQSYESEKGILKDKVDGLLQRLEVMIQNV